MANQQGVQDYLQRHKIGSLFENLMSKVIGDLPDDPLNYLIRVIQLRVEKRDGKSALRKSTPDPARGKTRSPSPLRKSMPASAWASHDDGAAVAKDTKYDKPWLTNSKRSRPRTSPGPVDSTAKKSGMSKVEWDSTVKAGATSFDDLFEPTLTKTKKPGRSTSPPSRAAKSAWASTVAEEDDVMYNSYGYSGPQKNHRDSADPLAGEFPLAKTKTTTTTSATSGGKPCKHKGRREDSLRHKHELQLYIQQQEQKRSDSGFEDDKDLDPDYAMELMEDTDELRREGVSNAKRSGVKMSASMRRPARAPEPQVRVSYCARCAKVMGGGMPSEPDSKYGQLPGNDTERDTARNPVHTGRSIPLGSDDEFESVSQVTGPRRPVWQESNNEALTPRKGKSMLASNMAPAKGMPMYSSSGQPGGPSGGKRGASTMRSEDFYHHDNRGATTDAMRKTWGPTAATSGAYSEDEGPGDRDPRGWQMPDYDTDSSYYGAPGGAEQRKVTSHAY